MTNRNAIAAWMSLLCLAQSGLMAATIGGWLFEGTPGQPAGEVTNSAVPDTLTGVATTNPLVFEGGDFVMGTSGNYYYDGWIDEVRVTGRVLSTNEFLRTMRLGTLIRVE